MMMPNVGRNKRSALRRMDWCNALRLLRPTELEQTIALNVAEILEA